MVDENQEIPQDLGQEQRTESGITEIPRIPTKPLTRRNIKKRLREAEGTSMVDPKTGLHNDRWLEERIDNAIRDFKRTKKPFWVLFMDFDNFKKYNDRFSHSGGDEVLRLMTVPKTRPGEDIARFGGDEFIQILNDDIKEEDAVGVAQRNASEIETRSRNVIASLPVIDNTTNPLSSATVSLGLLEYRPGMNYRDIISFSSQALAEAKTNGRNKIVVKPVNSDLKVIDRTE